MERRELVVIAVRVNQNLNTGGIRKVPSASAAETDNWPNKNS